MQESPLSMLSLSPTHSAPSATPRQDSESFPEILMCVCVGGWLQDHFEQDRLCDLVHTDTTIQQVPCAGIIFSCFALLPKSLTLKFIVPIVSQYV